MATSVTRSEPVDATMPATGRPGRRRQDGDQQAFDELVRATYADTYTLALRLTGDEEDARDVVQEAYLRAYRGLKRFRGDAQFSTWLYRITANCAVDPPRPAGPAPPRRARRRRAGRRRRPDADPAGLGRRRRAARPPRATRCAELPPRLRAVVVLRDVYDLPHEAIAAELGISESAAKVRLHRARRKLREQPLPAAGRATATRRSDAHAV